MSGHYCQDRAGWRKNCHDRAGWRRVCFLQDRADVDQLRMRDAAGWLSGLKASDGGCGDWSFEASQREGEAGVSGEAQVGVLGACEAQIGVCCWSVCGMVERLL